MDSIIDRITAIKYEFDYLNNEKLLIKKIANILNIYDRLSYEQIANKLILYNNVLGFHNVSNDEIREIVNNLSIPVYTTLFRFNISENIYNYQNDVPIVLKQDELNLLECKKYKELNQDLKSKLKMYN